MRKICKSRQPNKWTEYCSTPGVAYEAIPELRQSLLDEQGHICAYCMRRIEVKDTNSNETSRIEHILSRERHPDLELQYSNMAICCPGAINDDFHCDKLKGGEDITFDLYSDPFFQTLSYRRTGEICSSNTTYNDEIEHRLNLNNKLLRENRRRTLKGVINHLEFNGWTIANIRKQITLWDKLNEKGFYNEYCGIVIWYLNKKLQNQNL